MKEFKQSYDEFDLMSWQRATAAPGHSRLSAARPPVEALELAIATLVKGRSTDW